MNRVVLLIAVSMVVGLLESCSSTGSLPQLPPLTAQQQAALMAGNCLTIQMAPASLACAAAYQNKTDKTQTSATLATCMATAQAAAQAACAQQINSVIATAPVAK